MLQDLVWVQRSWLDDPANQDIAERFLRASFRGWIYCRDNFEPCVEAVLAAGPPSAPRTRRGSSTRSTS